MTLRYSIALRYQRLKYPITAVYSEILQNNRKYCFLLASYFHVLQTDSWHVFQQDVCCSTQRQGFVESGFYIESDRAYARIFSALVCKLLTWVPHEYFVLLGYTRYDLLWRVQTRRMPRLFLLYSYFIFSIRLHSFIFRSYDAIQITYVIFLNLLLYLLLAFTRSYFLL